MCNYYASCGAAFYWAFSNEMTNCHEHNINNASLRIQLNHPQFIDPLMHLPVFLSLGLCTALLSPTITAPHPTTWLNINSLKCNPTRLCHELS